MIATDIVTNIDYNARGQRTLIAYGNGSDTAYTYDPHTFRVRRIHTERPHGNAALRTVQDLRYHYDPSGNITRIRDDAQQGVFFANAYVDGTQSFEYDPTYRLVRATGREHAALTVPTPKGFVPISHPQDSTAQSTYTQTYLYDAVGNIQRMSHASGGGGWQRGYDYHPGSNRLRATSVFPDAIDAPENYTDDGYEHDEHGNMTAMSAIPGGLTWDEDDRLQKTDDVGGGVTYYVYDGAGQRVRKVHVKNSTRKQRLYFGAWELYRDEHNINTTPVLDLERATLHVHDDTGRICLIETKTAEDDAPTVNPANIARYQYSNHLGSANLELDDTAGVISYEEFHPYGTSSFAAANSAIEVSPKRYRYTGKERDEETGLAYHGARYYAPWLARWTSSDPIGLGDTPNRFLYCRANPVCLLDLTGTSAAVAGGGWLAGAAAAARGVLAAQSLDVLTPEPSDLLPHKWFGHAVVAAGALATIAIAEQFSPTVRGAVDSAVGARPAPSPTPGRTPTSPANDGNYRPVARPANDGGYNPSPPPTVRPSPPISPTPLPEPGGRDKDHDDDDDLTRIFYSVQNPEDSERLLHNNGVPWPTGDEKGLRDIFGPGLYTWVNRESAEQYMEYLEGQGGENLQILGHEIAESDLQQLKSVNMTTMSDDEVTVILDKGANHGFEQVIRKTGNFGVESYFQAHVYQKFDTFEVR